MKFPIAACACAAFLIASAGAATIPAFDVTVQLSRAASKKLTAAKEGITLAAMIVGQLKAPKPDEDPETMLGDTSVEIAGAGIASFPPIEISGADMKDVDGEPQLLINFYSSRKSSPDNLLDCGIWQDVVSKLPAEKIVIDCKLIGE